jgi:gamma-glutamylcyclotransferase (GGCT)/AIG2-like uncharacterized protein YtfP
LYGTLLMPFNRTAHVRIDDDLVFHGRGTIAAALFDLGSYPAAVPYPDGVVRGEVFAVSHPDIVLGALDAFEEYRPAKPQSSLYIRQRTPVTMDDGTIVEAFAYFYNAPLGRAERITSGDYLEYLGTRSPG